MERVNFQAIEKKWQNKFSSSKLYKKNGEKFFVRSGQSVSVNLIVRDKRIISILTDAIDKAIDSLRGIKS